jgi:mannose-6-phosphate isomerase-like protein (cupin superfamily)/predicted DNA-binding protein (MmcQ/YjbR family)
MSTSAAKSKQDKKEFDVYNIEKALKSKKSLEFVQFSTFNEGAVGVFASKKGTSPWELHPDSDEFLQVIEGSADIEILNEQGSSTVCIQAGECFVVPRGHWHRHIIHKSVKELFVTPGTTQHSKLEDPRKTRAAKSSAKNVSSNLSDRIREIALSYPQTHEDHPWGYPAFKVKNKMFVAVSFQEHGIKLTVKLPNSQLKALAIPFVESSGYGLGEHGWISANLRQDEDRLSIDTIKGWIDESYRAVAPKSILKELDRSK